MKKESEFQHNLIQKIKERFSESMVLKNDPGYKQGVPDLLILFKDKWAALECKQTANSKKRPNQDYYVNKMNDMSFASFIYPENEEEVLNEMERSFTGHTRRNSCVSKRIKI